jgi:transcriptional regulator with XRE-family HTH domain
LLKSTEATGGAVGHQEGEVPPEASLIRLARQAKGLSPESAAALLPIKLSGNRWRQIEKGYERLVPFKGVRAPDSTLAHMAHTVGVTPDRLEGAERPEAAEILREILRSESEAQADMPETMSPREVEALAGMVASAAEGFDMSPADLEAAFRRAQQLVQQRRQERGHREGPKGSRHRAS